MLSSIVSVVGGQLIEHMLTPITAIFQAYFNKQVSEAQLRAQLLTALGDAAKSVEVSANDTLAKTYATFMATAEKSRVLMVAYVITLYSQVFILFWSQFFVPLMFAYDVLPNWKAGTTAEWAYLLIGFLLGGGPMILQRGPGAMSITDRLKSMVSK